MKKRSDSIVERQLLKALKLGDGVKAEDILRDYYIKITKKMVLAAAKRGGANCLEILIQNGADLDFLVRDTRMTLLHVVCESKYADANVVRVLIRKGGLDANASTRFLKSTPLMIAIESLPADIAVDIAQVLIENGANVNAGNDFNETALHKVSQQDDEYAEVADVLIRNGAVVNAVNVGKVTP